MLDQSEIDDFHARLAEVEAQRVAVGEVARWFVPWVLAGALALVFVGGLWCASGALDNGTYVFGLVAAAIALAVLLWELNAVLGAGIGNLVARCLVEDEASLIVLVAILVALALAGLVLAARSGSIAASGAGYGLFLFGIVFIFANLKHYFDRREGR
jgi:hypothetical protein